jgi:uncharacterized YceG family protein
MQGGPVQGGPAAGGPARPRRSGGRTGPQPWPGPGGPGPGGPGPGGPGPGGTGSGPQQQAWPGGATGPQRSAGRGPMRPGRPGPGPQQQQWSGGPQQGWPGGVGPQQAWPGSSGPQQRMPPHGAGWQGGGPRWPGDQGDEPDDGFLPYDEDDEGDDDDRPRKRRRRFRWLAPLIAAIIIVIPLGAAGYFGVKYYMGKYHPANYSGSGTGTVTVQVASGSTATSLAPTLQSLGVVASSRAFVIAAEAYKGSGQMEAGYYELHYHMNASLAYAILVNPKNIVETILRFPEGLRSESVLKLLSEHTGHSLSQYDAAVKNPALGLPSYSGGKVEGFLFPDTYPYYPHETALQVLQTMVKQYDTETQGINLTTAAASVHLTPYQVIIAASMCQAEAGSDADMPKIARVIYNRMAAGMPMQFDSTVLYGLNSFLPDATDAQLKINTPWNTFLHKGLPPTPIDNPGMAAIDAVLHPATGNWLYFIIANGHSNFSATPIGSQ